MTGPLSETSPEGVSAHRWFRGTVGTAIGLSLTVNLISLLIPPNFVRSWYDAAGALMLWVVPIFIAHLLFCYPAARFLRKRILLGARRLWAAKGCVIGLLLALIMVDGFFCAGYILGIGDPRVGEAGVFIILYYGPIYLAELLGAIVCAGAGAGLEMALDTINRKREIR